MSSEAENLKKFQEFYNTPERIEAGLSLAELIEMNEKWEKERAEKGPVKAPEAWGEGWVGDDSCEEGCMCEGEIDPTPNRPVRGRQSRVERAKGFIRRAFRWVENMSSEDREDVYQTIRELQRAIQVSEYPAREAFIREKIEEVVGDKVSEIDIDLDREDWIDGEYNIHVFLKPQASEEEADYVDGQLNTLGNLYYNTDKAFDSYQVFDYHIEGLHEKAYRIMGERGLDTGKDFNEIMQELREEHYKGQES